MTMATPIVSSRSRDSKWAESVATLTYRVDLDTLIGPSRCQLRIPCSFPRRDSDSKHLLFANPRRGLGCKNWPLELFKDYTFICKDSENQNSLTST
ncbi:hypothetical protein CR513_19583, partial [Mucuna pruriens]